MRAVAEVTTLDNQLNAQIEAANTALLACAGMSASDITAWNGYYAGWGSLHSYWQQLTSGSWIPTQSISLAAASALVADSTYDQMGGFRDQLPAWQAKIHASCPSYSPPPGIVQATPHDKTLDWLPKVEEAVKIAAGATATIVVALLVLKVVQIIGDVRVAAKA